MSWKSTFLVLVLSVCANGQAVAAAVAIAMPQVVTYAPGISPDEGVRACDWRESIIKALVERAPRTFAPAGSADASRFILSIAVSRVDLKSSARKSEYRATARAEIRYDGKLVATRDETSDESFTASEGGCVALRGIAASIGESLADWAKATQFPACPEGCAGIHPDEPIVVASEVLITDASAINDTLRNDCGWTTDIVKKIVKVFNEGNTSPRAGLEPRAVDIANYPGRRLLLYVDSVHALGGGGLSGPKWMSMHGEMREGNVLIASFESYTSSGRGLTTCRSVESLSESTADLIAEWLRSPSLGAKLK